VLASGSASGSLTCGAGSVTAGAPVSPGSCVGASVAGADGCAVSRVGEGVADGVADVVGAGVGVAVRVAVGVGVADGAAGAVPVRAAGSSDRRSSRSGAGSDRFFGVWPVTCSCTVAWVIPW
jgi:hypothetical protein